MLYFVVVADSYCGRIYKKKKRIDQRSKIKLKGTVIVPGRKHESTSVCHSTDGELWNMKGLKISLELSLFLGDRYVYVSFMKDIARDFRKYNLWKLFFLKSVGEFQYRPTHLHIHPSNSCV